MNTDSCGKRTKAEILRDIDSCASIEELFAIVRQEHIELRMQTLCSASSIPPKELTFRDNCTESPLDRLKKAVRLAAEINL